MREIKTYFKGAPFYNAFLRTWPATHVQGRLTATVAGVKARLHVERHGETCGRRDGGLVVERLQAAAQTA
jgi:hypothetical protein